MSWKIIAKSESNRIVDALAEVFTNGLIKPPYDYKIKNEDTEEVRRVTANDNDHLAAKISKGRFN
jgi:hypothetical protein